MVRISLRFRMQAHHCSPFPKSGDSGRHFAADSSVGGRYSALTDFGMLPAALLGVDLVRFLDRAGWMQRQNARDMPTGRGPGVALGALLGEASLRGRDKLTLLADPEIETLPNWIEQLVAEFIRKRWQGDHPCGL